MKESENESILVCIGNYRLPSTASGHRKYAVERFLDYSKDDWKLCRRLAGLKPGAIGYGILKVQTTWHQPWKTGKARNCAKHCGTSRENEAGTAQGVDSPNKVK